MPRKKLPKSANKVAVGDFETDPFLFGRVPKPFVCGLYCPDTFGYRDFWGDDCVRQLLYFLDDLKDPHTFYFHNGGKFDFFLMLEHLENPVKIINGRIVMAQVGIHTFQDSYAILPVPLAHHDKGEIDYEKFEREHRGNHRGEICRYLRRDCDSLFGMVSAFRDRFGDRLTIGGTAISELKKLHPFDSQRAGHDAKFRPWYFGGRVEAFEFGVLKGDFHVYDVNSMYPHVMREYHHPTGAAWRSSFSGICDRRGRISGFADAPCYFVRIECQQSGAFPVRVKDGPLDFNVPEGEFFVTSHELRAAVETGRVQNIKIREVLAPQKTIQFANYVDIHMAEKIRAKKEGDKIGEIFAKLLLNSAYGKFGQNPEHYYDYLIVGEDEPNPEPPYEVYLAEPNIPSIWRKHSNTQAFYDVATAASITGAARAVLMRALAKAKRPVYCDTDSIICEGLDLPLDDSALGKWKLEARGNAIAIAGKKLYALRQGREYKKIASKGAKLTGPQIFEICSGKEIEWHKDSPTFSLAKPTSFIHRKIRLTVA